MRKSQFLFLNYTIPDNLGDRKFENPRFLNIKLRMHQSQFLFSIIIPDNLGDRNFENPRSSNQNSLLRKSQFLFLQLLFQIILGIENLKILDLESRPSMPHLDPYRHLPDPYRV